MELYLVRHGESKAQREVRVCGAMDSPLTLRGKAQARRLGEYYRRQGVEWDKVYVSPLARAKGTAEYLISHIDNCSVTYVPALKELDTGEYSELTFEELSRVAPELHNMRLFSGKRFPAGESLGAMFDRVQVWFRTEVLRSVPQPRNVLVVAHTGPISAIFHYLFSIPIEAYHPIELENCKTVHLRLASDDARWITRIIRINGESF